MDTAKPIASLWHRSRRTRVSVIVGLLAAAALFTAGAGWLLPRWLKPHIETAATHALNTPVALRELSISPWTLTVRLDGLRIGPADAAFITLDQAEARLSLQSLWHRAPVLGRLTLTRPQILLERTAGERFNISPVLDHLRAQPADPQAEPARFALHNIRIIDGLIRYRDHVLDPHRPTEHRISALNVGLPFISNLPSQIDTEVQPQIDAQINGSPLHLAGKAQPFGATRRAHLDIHWRNVDLAHWATALRPLLPPELQLDVARGALDTQLRLSFEQPPAPTAPRLKISGQIEIIHLDARWPRQALAWRWQSLSLSGLDTEPLARRAHLGNVVIKGLAAEWGPRPASPASATKTAPATQATAPWAWRIGHIDLGINALKIEPTAGQPWPAIGPAQLSLAGLDANAKAAPARLQLQAHDAQQGLVRLSGTVHAVQRTAALDLAIEHIQPAPWIAPFAATLPAHIDAGTLSIHGALQIDPHNITLKDTQLDIAGFKARSRAGRPGLPADRFDLPRLSAGKLALGLHISNANAQLDHIHLDHISAEGLDATASRTADGHWLWASGEASTATAPHADRAQAPSTAAHPNITLGALRCSGCNVAIRDHTTQPTSDYSLHQAHVHLRDLSSDLSRTSHFEIRGTGQRSGHLELTGEVRPQPLKLHSQIRLSNIDVRGVQPYVAPYLNLTLASAKVQADGRVALDTDARGELSAHYTGRLGLNELRTKDSITDADFVRLKAFSIDGIDAGWRNRALSADLGKIALKDFYARLILNPDGTLNVAQILRTKGQEATSITTPGASAPGAPEAAPSAHKTAPNSAAASAASPANTLPPDLRWRSVTLSGGRVDFTDTFIKPNYSARLTQINGSVSAVSSNRPEPADINITGKVDDAAPLAIHGRIHPLGPRLTTDITASARGIEMTRFSPYAARYAGYAIEKGSLSVKLNYKIDNGQLEASNNIVLDQLTFGDKTDSPDATQLPVLFAISLLKDRNGVIDVNLPISGSLDDPQFSVGGIVVRVIVNLLTKAVTAPFSLISSGGNSEELSHITFEPGSARLSDAARQRLDALAHALNERPALQLDITGQADPLLDTDGLKQWHVMRLMRQAKARATGEDPITIILTDDERPRWLEAAYKASDIKKPRNIVGLPKTLTPAEMQALLEASAPSGPEALLQLANRRADRVNAYLADKIAPERTQLTASKISANAEANTGPGTRVQFNMH